MGRDTQGCIQSGVFWGTVGMIREITAAAAQGQGGKCKIVITGGLGSLFAPEIRGSIADPDLTMKGLNLVLQNGSEENK